MEALFKKRTLSGMLPLMITPAASQSVLDLFGHTPAVYLNRLVTHLGLHGSLLLKLECYSPGGSKKDRVALAMIRAARATGKLADSQPVVEVTSGNTGIGLAIVCHALGHPFFAVMSAGNSPERAQMMRALGAQVVLVEQVSTSTPGKVTGADMKRVRDRAAALVKETGAFFCDQFENAANRQAHIDATGPELWQQSGKNIDAIVGFVGSGGALGGLATYLRTVNSDLRVYVIEPANSDSLATCCCCDAGHGIQGGGYGKASLAQMRDVPIDGYFKIADEHAAHAARLLAREEGIFAGYSTGAQLHAAIQLLRGDQKGKVVAFLACDSGMKYFSTDLWA
jgi:cysteine synthase A